MERELLTFSERSAGLLYCMVLDCTLCTVNVVLYVHMYVQCVCVYDTPIHTPTPELH